MRDGETGLRVVVCARCGAGSVRRAHPISAAWRWWLRTLAVLNTTALQFVGLFLAVIGVGGSCNEIRAELTALCANVLDLATAAPADRARMLRPVLEWASDAGFGSLLGWAFVCVIAGAWITVGLAHWRRPGVALGWALARGWLAWAGLLAFTHVIFYAAHALESALRSIPDHPSPMFARTPMPRLDRLLNGLVLIVPSALVALLGVPLGLACRFVNQVRARRRFIKRLRKLRARKQV